MKPNWIKNKVFPGEKFHCQTAEQGKPQISGPSSLWCFCPFSFALTPPVPADLCEPPPARRPWWDQRRAAACAPRDAVPCVPAAPGQNSGRFEVSGKFSIYFSRDRILPEVTADVQRDAPRPCRSPWLHLLPFAFPSASLPSAAARLSPRPNCLEEIVRGWPTSGS